MSEFSTPSANRSYLNERSYLVNCRFLANLNGWTAAGGAVYVASDGSEQYGLASLPSGASIAQAFAVEYARTYTLHVACKGGNATIAIVDGAGNSLPAQTATGASGVWTETSITLGLAPGTQYTITISNAGGSTILLDDVWLWYVPITRAQLAARVARKLSALASDASLSSTASGALTEGDYTDAIDAGCRAVGAVNPETDQPDVRWLDSGTIDTATELVQREMLQRLQGYYTSLTDIKVGPREEKLSQIASAIARMASGSAAGGGSRKVVTRALGRRADDYEMG